MKFTILGGGPVAAASMLFAFAAVDTGLPASPSALAAATTPAIPQAVAHELTAADAEAFLDGLVPLQIGMDDIAGATIAIVKDGKLLFAKGYGFADMKSRKPVVADATLFRIGSITKLFTWTAVMQLVEAGKIDLDADVNNYLDFTIPQPFGKPVTMRNLMTHRPGFEDVVKEIAVKNAGDVNLAAYLKEGIPAQIFEPGTVPAYSNYGAALAGYIVERVSGMPFDQYVEDRILTPLGMTHSTLRQPLPDPLAPQMSSGYNLASGAASEFEIVNAYPAGSMSAPATDMARFMLMHLNDGALDGARILKIETAQAMHNTRLETDPQLNAMALGFYEETRNGHRIIGHGGDTLAFHSDLHLIMDKGVGFFVSYNSQGRGDSSARAPLWRAFLDRYFPYAPPEQPTLASAKDDARKVVGVYRSSRRGDASWTKLLGVLGETTVSADADGVLSIDSSTDINGQPRHWREVAPLVYRNVVGQEKVVFKPDAAGTMTLLAGAPIQILQMVGPMDNQVVVASVAGASLSIIALALLLWPVAAIARRHYGTRLERSGAENLLRLGVFAVCAADLAFIIAFGAVLIPQLESISGLNRSLDANLHIVQAVGIAGALGAIIAVANAVLAWRSENRHLLGRAKETLIALACIGFAWFAWSMHLLDMGLRY